MAVGRAQVVDAGRGGLNLTHSETAAGVPRAISRSGVESAAAIDAFPAAGAARLERALGQETFVGSSGRVFHKRSRRRLCAGMVAAAWIQSACNSNYATAGPVGMQTAASSFKHPTDRAPLKPARLFLALGGASWRGSAPTAHGRKHSPPEA